MVPETRQRSRREALHSHLPQYLTLSGRPTSQSYGISGIDPLPGAAVDLVRTFATLDLRFRT